MKRLRIRKRIAVSAIFFSLLLLTWLISGCSGGGMPGGSSSGMPSNTDPPPLPTTSPTPTGTDSDNGRIEGTIMIAQGDDSVPAAGAFVTLIDQPLSTYADDNGEFVLEEVWPGDRLMSVNYEGSKMTGVVMVEAGKTTVMTIEIPEEGSGGEDPPPDGETGTLNIITYGYYEGDEWIGVNYIRVWEEGNYSRRWYASWDDYGNEGQTSFELSCFNAPMDGWYVVEIQWYDGEISQTHTVHLYLDNQTEYFYHQ